LFDFAAVHAHASTEVDSLRYIRFNRQHSIADVTPGTNNVNSLNQRTTINGVDVAQRP